MLWSRVSSEWPAYSLCTNYVLSLGALLSCLLSSLQLGGKCCCSYMAGSANLSIDPFTSGSFPIKGLHNQFLQALGPTMWLGSNCISIDQRGALISFSDGQGAQSFSCAFLSLARRAASRLKHFLWNRLQGWLTWLLRREETKIFRFCGNLS